jgi:hypothetical protein
MHVWINVVFIPATRHFAGLGLIVGDDMKV